MTGLNLQNIAAGAISSGVAAIFWDIDGAHYHVWVNYNYELTEDIVFKNPPPGTMYRGPGYFETRKLKLSVKKNADMVRVAIAHAKAEDLIAKKIRSNQVESENHELEKKQATARAVREALEKYIDPGIVHALPEDALIGVYMGVTSHKG